MSVMRPQNLPTAHTMLTLDREGPGSLGPPQQHTV